jgi:diazepam-binding inhibitor (GABA receptor modulator, acyl-CoA-binding protein)
MNLKEQFEATKAKTEKLTKRPSNQELLSLYALYKQAFDGDVSGDRPGGFDFKAIAKYDAWAALKGKGAEAAMQEYIDLVENLLSREA